MAHGQPSVIFDLDGTLVDSAADVAAILNRVIADANVGFFTPAEVARFMGNGIVTTIDKALTSRGHAATNDELSDLTARFTELYEIEPIIETQAYPHAVETLRALDQMGFVIGVCTNKVEKLARLVIERAGLISYIRAIVGADTGYGLKPSAAPPHACAELLGVLSSTVTYIGDHKIDLAAGRAADMRVFLVAYGYGYDDATAWNADGVINCLSELPRLLRQMG